MIRGAFPISDLWKPLAPPHIRWDPTRRVNGSARLARNGVPVISTTIGLYHRVYDFAYRLFTTSDLVRNIGEPGREGGTVAERFVDRQWLRDPGDPQCEVRRAGCFVLAECAIAFVFYHEASHIALEHLTKPNAPRCYSEWVGRRSALAGGRRRTATTRSLRRRQLEEIQADRAALAIAFDHLRKTGGVFPGQIIDGRLNDRLPELLMMAQVALHMLLADTLHEVCDFDELDHPHPLTRLIDAVGSFGRAGLMTSTNLESVADASRLAVLMRRQRMTAELFARMQAEARLQYSEIVDSVTGGSSAP